MFKVGDSVRILFNQSSKRDYSQIDFRKVYQITRVFKNVFNEFVYQLDINTEDEFEKRFFADELIQESD